jgi:hypothetical protein
MSTVSVSYPDVIRVRRAPAIGRILILSGFVLIAVTTLVMVTSAHADLTDQPAVSQNSLSPIPVPVPTPANANIQPNPSETPSPSSGLDSGLSVVAVPVPTPPSQ